MKEHEGRRRFLARATGAIAALVGVTIGIPLAGYTIIPAFKRRKPVWMDIGPVEALRTGVPTELELVLSVKDGWHKTNKKKSVWAAKDSTGQIIVYSPICTHLGCGYRWVQKKQSFLCPCHNSVFALDGKVIKGPAPRPLDRLPVKMDGDRILTRYKEFKAGISRQIAL